MCKRLPGQSQLCTSNHVIVKHICLFMLTSTVALIFSKISNTIVIYILSLFVLSSFSSAATPSEDIHQTSM
jgi:hypothetical protein